MDRRKPAPLTRDALPQPICGYHQDELGDWVARLACGHNQHVRHQPPWQNRPWVINAEERRQQLGSLLLCKKCVTQAPRDWSATHDDPALDSPANSR
ncbi:DUF3565 domain-containing protein [Balneatrix alpica]|uniref:DUF3565 domain-containing protein n=1 Tax=Balneatrix alpica TaxID=75684 RepID=UPI0035184EC8